MKVPRNLSGGHFFYITGICLHQSLMMRQIIPVLRWKIGSQVINKEKENLTCDPMSIHHNIRDLLVASTSGLIH